MGVERKKKGKNHRALFIASSGNCPHYRAVTGARLDPLRRGTLWQLLWPCISSTRGHAAELEAVERILCAGQRRKRGDVVFWSNTLEYPVDPDNELTTRVIRLCTGFSCQMSRKIR